MSDTIALVGSETLMGRELRDLLAGNSLGADVRLVAGDDASSGVLSEHAGEAAVLTKLDLLAVTDVDVVILAGSPESSRTALDLAPGNVFIDLTHAAEENPRSRLRAPMVEPFDFRVAPDAIQSIAHPAAIALALLLGRIDTKFKLANWSAHIFEPASERGLPGVEELQQQAVSLLSFKPLPKKIFDNQLSFNLLSRLGEEAPVSLEQVEARIERHLATLLQNAGQTPMPSIRLVQAPVFHGYSFSVWIEFADHAPDPLELEAALGGDDVEVQSGDLEPPNNVGMAGQNGVAIGAITRDRNHPHALWLWMVADNLRLSAQNALLVAREIL